jgi:serine/threonine protein kinase
VATRREDELGATVAAPSGGVAANAPTLAHTGSAAASTTGGGKRTPVLPPDAGAPAAIPARYEPLRRLGAGGMGVVELARDHDIGRTVAIKRPTMALDVDGLSRFAREVRTIGRLEHPGIVPIHDVGLDEDGRHYFVMKYVEGTTLKDVISSLTADPAAVEHWPHERRLQLVIQLCHTVQYAHAAGVLHRDIKPDNVMIGPFGEVLLMDWGIARAVAEPEAARPEGGAPSAPFATSEGALLGTPAYMSPEQARGTVARLDGRSDVYSLCVLLWELMALEHPLADRMNLGDLLTWLRSDEDLDFSRWVRRGHERGVPPEFIHLCYQGMRKDPAARHQSVDELLAELGHVRDHRGPIRCHNTLIKSALGRIERALAARSRLTTALLASFVALATLGLVTAVLLLWRAMP